jgi:glucosamine-6-phosphate deaminase
VRTLRVDALAVRIHDELDALARDAADLAEAAIVEAVRDRGRANVMFASGNSQVAFLSLLVTRLSIDWPRVVAFHMDEYVGVGPEHPASFARYMRERIASLAPVGEFNYLRGDAPDPQAEATRYAARLAAHPLDLCCLGIGENGHLAFNDPPPGGADFDDPVAAKIVTLDDRCKAQQVGEGHFPTIADVPPTAITVTIPGLLGARHVLAIVPEARKAAAVHAALAGAISPACPASALRRADHATLLLDRDSARLLS